MSRRPAAAVVVAALVAAGCGGGRSAAPPTSSSTTTTTAPTTTTTVPPSTTTTTTGPPPAGRAAPPAARPPGACPAIPDRASPRPDRSHYTLQVDVKPGENAVDGRTDVRFTPDLPTDKLVLRLWANAPRTARAGARLDVGAVSVGGRAVPYEATDPTTVVAHAGSLAPGRPVDVSVPWHLVLPGQVDDRISRTGDAIRLGSFFPVVAWEPGIGWAEQPATSGFAEAATTPAADVDATVTVPAGFDVLATGTPDGAGRWTAAGVPDFALSVGHFVTASGTANAPQPVQVTVAVADGIAEAPSRYLAQIVSALEDYSRRFGPYPWPTYTMAVTPGLHGGIEYPMHVLQGPGTGGGTTVHEAAHMWFYGLVEDNQGRDPWLDEGLATYAQARHQGTLASLQAALIPPEGRGRVGEPMTYWETRQSIYYRSVYVQGAQALAALGDPALVDCALRLYVARTAYRVARPGDLVGAAAAVFPDAAAVLARYGIRG